MQYWAVDRFSVTSNSARQRIALVAAQHNTIVYSNNTVGSTSQLRLRVPRVREDQPPEFELLWWRAA